MSAAENDLILNNLEKAIENHKNNMRSTFTKLKQMEKREKEINGESTSNFIYGNSLEEYSNYFNDEKKEKEREAEQLRQLREYINNISLENNSSHLNKYSCKEVKRIDDELKKINHEIKDNDEINK